MTQAFTLRAARQAVAAALFAAALFAAALLAATGCRIAAPSTAPAAAKPAGLPPAVPASSAVNGYPNVYASPPNPLKRIVGTNRRLRGDKSRGSMRMREVVAARLAPTNQQPPATEPASPGQQRSANQQATATQPSQIQRPEAESVAQTRPAFAGQPAFAAQPTSKTRSASQFPPGPAGPSGLSLHSGTLTQAGGGMQAGWRTQSGRPMSSGPRSLAMQSAPQRSLLIRPASAVKAAEPLAEPFTEQLPIAAQPAPGLLNVPTPPPDGAAPPSSLSLIEALNHGLAYNPNLVTLRQQEGVGQAMVGVAQKYPFNPILQTRVLPFDQQKGVNTPVYNYVLFWQTFELAHQRRYRTQNAAAALGGVRWNIAQAELLNLSQTEQLYFTALYQRGLLELAQANARLNQQLLDVTEKQFSSGAASAADVAQTRLDLQTSRQQQRLGEANYQTALEALRQQLNLPLESPLELAGSLENYRWRTIEEAVAQQGGLPGYPANLSYPANIEQIAARFATTRPDVMAAQSNVAAARANVSLAKAMRVPNVMAGPFYIHDASATLSLGLQAQFEVPVVNGGRPLVRQRVAEFSQQAVTHEQLEARAQVEGQTALKRYRRALKLLEEARTEAGEDLPAELQRLEELYARGEVDVIRVVQARTSALSLRRAFLDNLNEVAQAAAAVTLATGLPPHELIDVAP